MTFVTWDKHGLSVMGLAEPERYRGQAWNYGEGDCDRLRGSNWRFRCRAHEAHTKFHTAPWRDMMRRRLWELRKLEDNWDGYKSKAPDKRLLVIGSAIVENALSDIPEALAPYVIPLRDGGVQFDWSLEQVELEFSISKSGDMYAWIEDRETGADEDAEGPEAQKLLIRWAHQLSKMPSSWLDFTAPTTTADRGVKTRTARIANNTSASAM